MIPKDFSEWHQQWVDGILLQWEQRRLNPHEELEEPKVKRYGLRQDDQGDLPEPTEWPHHDKNEQHQSQ